MVIERAAGTIRAMPTVEPYAVETATGVYLVGEGGKVLEKLEPSVCPCCDREAGSDAPRCGYCST